MKGSVRRELFFDTAESETLSMWGNSMRENRETLQTPTLDGSEGRSEKAKAVMSCMCLGESDDFIVPTKRANKVDAYALAAESVEGRGPTKGNASQAHLRRTQSRGCESQSLWRIRQAARAAGRHMNPRQEPYEVIPHVRICAGGRSQGRSLPRLNFGVSVLGSRQTDPDTEGYQTMSKNLRKHLSSFCRQSEISTRQQSITVQFIVRRILARQATPLFR